MIIMKRFIIGFISVLGVYFLLSLYFINHYYFHTNFYGVDISFLTKDRAKEKIQLEVKRFQMNLNGRAGARDTIKGKDINLTFVKPTALDTILSEQNSLEWIKSLFKTMNYKSDNVYRWDEVNLENAIINLSMVRNNVTLPRDVRFHYKDGSYYMEQEIEGTLLNQQSLFLTLKDGLKTLQKDYDLDSLDVYIAPQYRMDSIRSKRTLEKLNQMIRTTITYRFGDDLEVLDHRMIQHWIELNEDLDVRVDQKSVRLYLKTLVAAYDTVGIERQFKTSTGRMITVVGGLYGWKIDVEKEQKELTELIKQGAIVEREPIYKQIANGRGEDEIGSSYIEISITDQALWFYVDGVLLVSGPVVTGNPNRGNGTVTGVYMLNYKQKDTVIRGANYEAKVTYWMPFFGNIGIHDATWRSSFGGRIYLSRGSHGCVNAPYGLAQKVFEYIHEGIPIIVY